DPVAADDVAVALVDVDAEQAILDDVVLDDVVAALDPDRGVDLVVQAAGVGDGEPLELGPRRLDGDDRSFAAAVDRDAGGSVEHDRPPDDDALAIDAGRRRDDGIVG